MAERIKIGVIFGGKSGEHEVSLMSARSILSVLNAEKFEVTQIGITHDGHWLTGPNVIDFLDTPQEASLASAAILPDCTLPSLYTLKEGAGGMMMQELANLDVIFPVLHGSFGEDGTIQGLLEMADAAYVGAGVLASSVGMDKALFKDVMRAHGLPVVPSVVLSRREIEKNMEAALAKTENLGHYPLFVKPANLGSSVGITKCRSRGDLMEGLLEAARYDRRILVEVGIESPREMEVAVLGNEEAIASVPGEVVPCDDFYTYRAKYLDEGSRLLIPAPLAPEVAARMSDLAVRAYQAVDGAGLGRVDFLLDPHTDDIYISEINTLPGFTKISMYPKLWEASGISYSKLVEQLVNLAMERKQDRDRTERRFRSA